MKSKTIVVCLVALYSLGCGGGGSTSSTPAGTTTTGPSGSTTPTGTSTVTPQPSTTTPQPSTTSTTTTTTTSPGGKSYLELSGLRCEKIIAANCRYETAYTLADCKADEVTNETSFKTESADCQAKYLKFLECDAGQDRTCYDVISDTPACATQLTALNTCADTANNNNEQPGGLDAAAISKLTAFTNTECDQRGKATGCAKPVETVAECKQWVAGIAWNDFTFKSCITQSNAYSECLSKASYQCNYQESWPKNETTCASLWGAYDTACGGSH